VAAILISPFSYGDLPRGTEIRAFMGESCVIADEPYLLELSQDAEMERSLSLSGLVVSKLGKALLGKLVSATSSQLGKFKKSKDMYYVAAKDFNLYHAALYESPDYQLNANLSCATVVAAQFEPNEVDCSHLYEPKVLPAADIEPDEFASRATRQDESIENILRRANICLRGPAYSIYEVRFEKSDDLTAYRLQSAGLWVNSLLSTKSKKATRGVVYTMDINEPAADSDMRTLSSAWVDIGTVKAGHVMDEPPATSRSEWLRVPVMSPDAERVYQVDTSVHQDVYAEIQALERSIVRDRRQLEGMRERLATASDSIKAGMEIEMEGIELRILRNEALLDARRAEYLDLPQFEKNYMPVSIRFGLIESRSPKRALAALGSYLESNSSRTAGDNTTVERSADLEDLPEAGSESGLQQTRTDYFDALTAYRESTYDDTPATADIERNLTLARDRYNSERAAAGIAPIQ
jgi:hypothetical protein